MVLYSFWLVLLGLVYCVILGLIYSVIGVNHPSRGVSFRGTPMFAGVKYLGSNNQ